MTYYLPLAGCRLLVSENGGALYDEFGGRLALLDGAGARAIERAAREPLEAWAGSAERAFLERLQREGFVLEEPRPAFVEPLLAHAPYAQAGIAAGPPLVHEIAWDLGTSCAGRCAGCHAGSGVRTEPHVGWQACLACVRGVAASPVRWSAEELARVVDDAAALEPAVLLLRGGDPFRDFVRLAAIRERVRRHPELTLVATTHGAEVDIARVSALYAGGGFRLAVVLAGASDETSTRSYGLAGAFTRQAALVDRLLERGLPFHLVLLLTDATCGERDAIVDGLVRRFGALSGIAEWRSEPSLAARAFSHVAAGVKPLSPWRGRGALAQRAAFRPCLDGRFEIGPDGRLRPCAAIDVPYASAAGEGLAAALASNEPRASWWSAAKGRAGPCRTCRLRLACTDCAAAERFATAHERWSALCPGGTHTERVSVPDGLAVCRIELAP